uniref:Uncharacterized protein n=1 Tax=Medicago truncatula TaxID=3880 RepID=I3SXP6_MEDTR|nr:unknown [Medicago truncatula]
MCMPKKCSSLTSNGEIVCITMSRLNWTLCDICRSISPTCSQLPNTMPMDGNIVVDLITNFDYHCIIFPGIKSGSRKLPINCDNCFA